MTKVEAEKEIIRLLEVCAKHYANPDSYIKNCKKGPFVKDLRLCPVGDTEVISDTVEMRVEAAGRLARETLSRIEEIRSKQCHSNKLTPTFV